VNSIVLLTSMISVAITGGLAVKLITESNGSMEKTAASISQSMGEGRKKREGAKHALEEAYDNVAHLIP